MQRGKVVEKLQVIAVRHLICLLQIHGVIHSRVIQDKHFKRKNLFYKICVRTSHHKCVEARQ